VLFISIEVFDALYCVGKWNWRNGERRAWQIGLKAFRALRSSRASVASLQRRYNARIQPGL
jgi:hypothetical protein